jgi:hypothetical protein
MHTKLLLENIEGKDHMGDLGAEGDINMYTSVYG